MRWLSILLGSTLLLLLLMDRPLIRGDGVAYLAWIDTLVLDADLDFENQLAKLAPVNNYQLQRHAQSGRLVNIFPFGIALLLAPFYLIGHLFTQLGWWQLSPDYFRLQQGVPAAYSLWLMIGANLLLLVTVAAGWSLGRSLLGSFDRALATFAVVVGTPLIYYASVSPLNSHIGGAFATAIFLLLLARVQPIGAPPARQRPLIWLLLGVSAGLMVLARWQLLLVAAPAWLIFAPRGAWRGWLLALLAAAVSLLPLPLVWQQLFGEPFVIPYDAVNGGGFLSLPRNMLGVLLQTLWHSPLLLAALAGIGALWRIDRRWALYALLAIGLQLWLNGGVLDWWAGETYGMRRMSELFALYALLISALLAAVDARTRLRTLLRLLLAFGIVYSLLYIIIFVNFTWTNTDGVFIDHPLRMWRHFGAQPLRWRISWEVWRAHLGPWAWSMPGP